MSNMVQRNFFCINYRPIILQESLPGVLSLEWESCIKQMRRILRPGPGRRCPGCLGACTGFAGCGYQRSAVMGWESGCPWAWTGCPGPGAVGMDCCGVAEVVTVAAGAGGVGTLVPPPCRTGRSHMPEAERRPSAAGARNYSRWGHWCSGWRRSGSSAGLDPTRIRYRCPIIEWGRSDLLLQLFFCSPFWKCAL